MFILSKPLILASNSPRRKQLLQETGFAFDVKVIPTDEAFPPTLPSSEVAAYIAARKAEVFRNVAYQDQLVLTADTVVVLADQILTKPANNEQAFDMIRSLSGQTHQVITAVSLLANERITTISDVATVTFTELSDTEINFYIETYKPFDKAGSYGIQEWIGMIGITSIQGSFYTIMGLPTHIVYQLLKPYMKQ